MGQFLEQMPHSVKEQMAITGLFYLYFCLFNAAASEQNLPISRSLVSEATTLPTVPQPLPLAE